MYIRSYANVLNSDNNAFFIRAKICLIFTGLFIESIKRIKSKWNKRKSKRSMILLIKWNKHLIKYNIEKWVFFIFIKNNLIR